LRVVGLIGRDPVGIQSGDDQLMSKRFALLVFTAAMACFGFTGAHAQTKVYLMRGLLNVSTGLDQFSEKLARKHIESIVGNHAAWSDFADDAIRGYRRGKLCRIVIVGHSLGADTAILMAKKLAAAKVPVALVITYGPFQSRTVPPNVSRMINYYRSNSLWNNVYSRSSGSRTRIKNVDLASHTKITHFNIERIPRLQAATMRAVRSAPYHCRRRRR
jgi:Lipase (class 3)